LTFFGAGEMAPVFIVWFAPIPNTRRIANGQFSAPRYALRRQKRHFLDLESGKTTAKQFLRYERDFCKSFILSMHRVGIEPTT
jgi:hypothetical protein